MEPSVREICRLLQNTHDIPAVTVGFVDNKGNHVCFGQDKDITNSQTNENTLFGIGSISKSFTSLYLSLILQEYSGVSWDTPLKTMFDEFSLTDPHREDKLCLRDMLSHKVGIELGETDFGYILGNTKREDIIRNLSHLPYAADFRTKMMYNNFIYAAAGSVAEKLTGQKYEDLLKEGIFRIIGMENTTFLDQIDECTTNVAIPHVGINGRSTPVDLAVHRMSSTVAPAASICSSARDMLKYIKFLLNKGKVGDIQVVNPRMLEECWKPQFALPSGKVEWDGYVSKPTFPVTETRDTYGFGWYMGTYRGYRMVAHSGELFGYDCLVTFYPEMNIGIYTNMNGPGGEPSYISNQLLHYYISDLLLGFEPWLSKETVVTFPEPWKVREAYFIPKFKSVVEKSLPCTHSLDVYVGKYTHGFLGEINIYIEDNKLHMKMGEIGKFCLYPNGSPDEFRMIGEDHMQFLHEWDLYSPSDWMMVKFNLPSEGSCCIASQLCCSLFESGPEFSRC